MSWLGCTAEGDWVHVQGKELCHFCFCIPPSWWSTLWERNLLQGISSFRSKFIPLTVVHFRSMSSSIKAYRNLKNYLFLKDCRTTCHYNYTPSYLNQWRKNPYLHLHQPAGCTGLSVSSLFVLAQITRLILICYTPPTRWDITIMNHTARIEAGVNQISHLCIRRWNANTNEQGSAVISGDLFWKSLGLWNREDSFCTNFHWVSEWTRV